MIGLAAVQKVLLASLALNLAGLSVSGYVVQKRGGIPLIIRKVQHVLSPFDAAALNGGYANTRASVCAELPTRSSDTVFIGDSLVNFGEWSELMNDPHCRNRGIAGDTTADVLARIDPILGSGTVWIWN